MESQVSFSRVVSRGCGIDVHKKIVVATINGEGLKKETREYGTFKRSLTELRDWLLGNGITHVVEHGGLLAAVVYGQQIKPRMKLTRAVKRPRL